MFVNSDFSDLLKLFNDNHVKYLVIASFDNLPKYLRSICEHSTMKML